MVKQIDLTKLVSYKKNFTALELDSIFFCKVFTYTIHTTFSDQIHKKKYICFCGNQRTLFNSIIFTLVDI